MANPLLAPVNGGTLPGRPVAAAVPALAQRLLAATACALAGLTLLAAVGLSQPNAVHEAAHDVRHATGFPCH